MAQQQCVCPQAGPAPTLETWNCVRKPYQPGLITVVTPRWAIFSMINKWLRRPLPSPDDCEIRINVAVMQRMYMSALKVEIAILGIRLRFSADSEDDDSDLSEVTKALPGFLERYS
jgi:hypothetical protein